MATTEVTVGVIKDASITAAKMAANSVDSASYVDGSIDPEHLANNAVTLAKMASGTDGNIISFDSSGNPVAISTGTDGQVLTSAGAGAQPAFEDLAAGGGTSFITTVTASGSSALTPTGFNGSVYSSYIVTLNKIVLSSGSASFRLKAVESGGTFSGGNYTHNYSEILIGQSASGFYANWEGATAGYIHLAENIDGPMMGSYIVTTLNSSHVHIQGHHIADKVGATYKGGPFQAYIHSNLTLTGLTFYPTAGNITSGSITVTGIKNA
tara:strand:- start:244 stop:1044 length:801 start_codon:yes stop_codon:yes gene_type:complete